MDAPNRSTAMPTTMKVSITATDEVTAMVYPPARKGSLAVSIALAHGAGANQSSPFMVRMATDLAARGIGCLTFNFLYTERRRRIPDRNDALELCYRKVIEAFHDGKFRELGAGKLVIGGKSMGGRIASQVAAAGDADVAGLVFLGYPLHPPGQPEKLRDRHLPSIKAPMLFVQGARDAFGTPEELRPVLKRVKAPVELCAIEGADHSLKVPKKASRPQVEVDAFVLDTIETWVKRAVLKGARQSKIGSG
jgi:predicted alpha/beta-hydrolase family hydrolase